MPVTRRKTRAPTAGTAPLKRGGAVLVLNGPNLNMLGSREPEIYGTLTLADIESQCQQTAAALGLSATCRQSNHEGELIGWIQSAAQQHQAIIINAGAYSHTSIALLDALRGCGLPIYEVHLSNIYRREEFRQDSFISQVATGVICGFGAEGYTLALRAIANARTSR